MCSSVFILMQFQQDLDKIIMRKDNFEIGAFKMRNFAFLKDEVILLKEPSERKVKEHKTLSSRYPAAELESASQNCLHLILRAEKKAMRDCLEEKF